MDKVFFARDDSTTSYEISLYNTKQSCCSYTETGEIDKVDAIWEGPGNWIILYFTCIYVHDKTRIMKSALNILMNIGF